MKFLSVLLVLCGFASAQSCSASIIYNFGATATDGIEPLGGLAIDSKGNLYGTTAATLGCASAYCGTVFKVTPAGIETVLHPFTDGTDGAFPVAAPAVDSKGNVYGTTELGANGGVAFKVTAAGTYSVLHKFGGSKDGNSPSGPVILDSAGNIYGTTFAGGSSASKAGIVFKLSPKGQRPSCTRSPEEQTGGWPMGNLLRDSAGKLYGAASAGRLYDTGYNGGSPGYSNGGILFELSAKNKLTVLYDFCKAENCSDGARPQFIVRNASGAFFSNVQWVDADIDLGANWAGGVAQWSTKSGESVPVAFDPFDDPINDCGLGCTPSGSLGVVNGTIFGTTSTGGLYGGGTVFSVSPSGALTVIYSFGQTTNDGYGPDGGLVFDSKGNLYGTTAGGGEFGRGTIFKLTKN